MTNLVLNKLRTLLISRSVENSLPRNDLRETAIDTDDGSLADSGSEREPPRRFLSAAERRAERAKARPPKKNRCINAHVTQDFYARCVTAAGDQPVGEWARSVLEAHLDRTPLALLTFAELRAVRRLLVQGLMLPTRPVSSEEIKTLLEAIDEEKIEKAQAELAKK